jgi:predicted flavoprotein YhiN
MDLSGTLLRSREGGEKEALGFFVDLLPETPVEEIKGPCFEGKGSLRGRLRGLGLPRKLTGILLETLGLTDGPAAELSRVDRNRLLTTLKAWEIPIEGSLGFAKAETTTGGVPLSEVEARTMELKAIPGLYLCGELLDVDGPIGGFSFWLAFATGVLAGQAVAAQSL